MLPVRVFSHRAVSNRGPRRRRLTTSPSVVAAAFAVACALLPRPADAGLIITIDQVGPDVVASTPGGSLNTTSLFFVQSGTLGPYVWPVFAEVFLGAPGGFDQYGNITGPGSWGPPSSPTDADAGSGPLIGVSSGRWLVVPAGYISGTALAASTATFSSATIASLGLTPGSYEYTWGSGASADFLTVNIVPEPTTGALLALGVLVLAARRHSKRETARRRLP